MTHIFNYNLDAVIVGGGVIGLSIARELSKRGVRRIAVLEKGRIGSAASMAAAGMLTPNAECERFDDFHRLCVESLDRYSSFATELANETGIDVELEQSGTLCVALDEEDAAKLETRFRLHRTAGVEVESLTGRETLRVEPHLSTSVVRSLYYPNDWQVENRKLLQALRQYAEMNGIDVREHTSVESVTIENARATGVKTGGGRLGAGAVVIAAGAWTSLIDIEAAPIPITVTPIRGQMLSYRIDAATFRQVVHGPRCYVVPRRDGRLLVGATVEDVGFDDRVTGEGVEFLRRAAVEMAPMLDGLPIADRWSGLRPFVAADGLPVIGAVPGYRDLYAATGHYRNGILLAPMTADLLASRLVGGAESNYLRAFGAARFTGAKSVRRSS